MHTRTPFSFTVLDRQVQSAAGSAGNLLCSMAILFHTRTQYNMYTVTSAAQHILHILSNDNIREDKNAECLPLQLSVPCYFGRVYRGMTSRLDTKLCELS